jgi:hypothetical protein
VLTELAPYALGHLLDRQGPDNWRMYLVHYVTQVIHFTYGLWMPVRACIYRLTDPYIVRDTSVALEVV